MDSKPDLTKNAFVATGDEAKKPLADADSYLARGCTMWFTGLSGAGKSTLSCAVKARIDAELGDTNKVFVLDGDVIRKGLNNDLGFTANDRQENIRRISEVSRLFAMSGQICITAFISPYSKDRDFARKIHHENGIPYFECFINAPLEVCESRDVKGLYKKARAGEIKNFTGISDPYDEPANPEMDIRTDLNSLDECVEMVMQRLKADGCLKSTAERSIAQSLIQEVTGDQGSEYAALKVLDIDREHCEYLQTIAEGWAAPLECFMNEMQLLECMHMKTVTCGHGQKHLMSVPITLAVTKEEMEGLKNEKKIAIKCSAVD